MRWILAASVLLLMISASNAVSETRTEALLAACEKRMKVAERVEGKIEFVGEKIDAYCEGFLSGVFEVLSSEKNICAKGEAPTPEYLASVLKTYAVSNAKLKVTPAATVVRDAFRRAFPCEDKKKDR